MLVVEPATLSALLVHAQPCQSLEVQYPAGFVPLLVLPPVEPVVPPGVLELPPKVVVPPDEVVVPPALLPPEMVVPPLGGVVVPPLGGVVVPPALLLEDVVLPPLGGVVLPPEGLVVLPGGVVVPPEGLVVLAGGVVFPPEGLVVLAGGVVLPPEGLVVLALVFPLLPPLGWPLLPPVLPAPPPLAGAHPTTSPRAKAGMRSRRTKSLPCAAREVIRGPPYNQIENSLDPRIGKPAARHQGISTSSGQRLCIKAAATPQSVLSSSGQHGCSMRIGAHAMACRARPRADVGGLGVWRIAAQVFQGGMGCACEATLCEEASSHA